MTHHESHPVAIVGLGDHARRARRGDAFWTTSPPASTASATCRRQSAGTRPCTTTRTTRPRQDVLAIGGWVREFDWDPAAWRLPIPPKVAAQMDEASSGRSPPPGRRSPTPAGRTGTVDSERVAVILGNAIGGEKHYQSNNLRIRFPEMLRRLEQSAPSFATLPDDVREQIIEETRAVTSQHLRDHRGHHAR
jgi:hypothetical protein